MTIELDTLIARAKNLVDKYEMSGTPPEGCFLDSTTKIEALALSNLSKDWLIYLLMQKLVSVQSK